MKIKHDTDHMIFIVTNLCTLHVFLQSPVVMSICFKKTEKQLHVKPEVANFVFLIQCPNFHQKWLIDLYYCECLVSGRVPGDRVECNQYYCNWAS